MGPGARWIFIVLFVLAGLAMIAYAVRLWRHSDDEDDAPPPEDKNGLK